MKSLVKEDTRCPGPALTRTIPFSTVYTLEFYVNFHLKGGLRCFKKKKKLKTPGLKGPQIYS